MEKTKRKELMDECWKEEGIEGVYPQDFERTILWSLLGRGFDKGLKFIYSEILEKKKSFQGRNTDKSKLVYEILEELEDKILNIDGGIRHSSQA